MCEPLQLCFIGYFPHLSHIFIGVCIFEYISRLGFLLLQDILRREHLHLHVRK